MSSRILVVEDEKIIQLDLQYQLEQLGYIVAAEASSGEEAIAKAAQVQPDLILMDVRLRGEMNGVEAARRIRSNRPVPIIYLTARNIGQVGGSDQEPLQPCLTKPFRIATLDAAIKRALEKPSNREPA